VVSFAGNASVIAPPSADRESAITSIDQLQLDRRTAIGEAVFTCLQAIRSFDAQATADPPPAHIVLLSDGDNTTGRSVTEAVDAAKPHTCPSPRSPSARPTAPSPSRARPPRSR